MDSTMYSEAENSNSTVVKALTNVHRKNDSGAQAMGTLHRYSCKLIEQTEAHIVVGLFLHF